MDVTHLKKGQNIAGVAILVTIFLAIAKAVVGIISGSIVLMADAIHSGADLVAIFASWFGLKLAQRKPNKKFPYGYYKAENLAAAVVSIFILYAAYEIFIGSYSRLWTISQIKIPFLALGVALVDAVVLFSLGIYEEQIGKAINSQSLVAMGKESKTHLLSSLIVFAAILFAYLKIPYIEGIIGIAIALLILKIGLVSARDSVFSLMDVGVEPSIKNKARKIIKSISGVEDVKSLKFRKSGPFIFGESDIKVKKFVDVARAHEISDKIEEKIKEKVSQLDTFTVHIEPFKSIKQKVAIPTKNKRGLDSEVAEQFARANYFIFVTIDRKNIKSHYIKKNPHKQLKVKVGLTAVHYILKEKVSALVTKGLGEISFHTLRDNFVDIYKQEGKTANQIINKFIAGKLKRFQEPTKKNL